jgi:2-polyprenyl-3-methyl-5-hydroxy-6-metoxy-1,4-benzoquinol methylase
MLARQRRITLELLAPIARGRVLDVGGGHGQLAWPLHEAGWDVTVLGSAPRCRERLLPQIEAGQVHFVCGDLLHAPWRDGAFDVVVAYRMLAHVRDWRALITELARLARRAVLVDYPPLCSVNLAARLMFALKRRVEGDTREFAIFRDRQVRQAFQEAGLRVTARQGQFVWPMALHRALGAPSLSRLLERSTERIGLTARFGAPAILKAERDAATEGNRPAS